MGISSGKTRKNSCSSPSQTPIIWSLNWFFRVMALQISCNEMVKKLHLHSSGYFQPKLLLIFFLFLHGNKFCDTY